MSMSIRIAHHSRLLPKEYWLLLFLSFGVCIQLIDPIPSVLLLEITLAAIICYGLAWKRDHDLHYDREGMRVLPNRHSVARLQSLTRKIVYCTLVSAGADAVYVVSFLKGTI